MAGRIDWDAVRERLAAAEAALAQAELTDAQRDAIFTRRAEELAAVPAPDAAAGSFEAVVFGLGDERYAVPSAQAREIRVLAPDEITSLPGTPPFVAGLINVRGRVVPVLDLRPLFGLAVATGDAAQAVLLLPGRRGDVALLTAERPIVSRLPKSGLDGLPAGPSAGLDPAWVHGVTADLIVVLDVDRLLEDERLLVQD